MRASRSSRTIAIVTPAGPAFFCAPAYRSPWPATSTGRDRKSDDESETNGTSSGTAGVVGNSTPWIVSFDVMWRYARPSVDRGQDLVVSRDPDEPVVLAGPHDARRTLLLRFLHRLRAPRSGDHVRGGAVVTSEEVHRHHRELHRRPALAEHHVVRVRDREQGSEVGLGFADHVLEPRACGATPRAETRRCPAATPGRAGPAPGRATGAWRVLRRS